MRWNRNQWLPLGKIVLLAASASFSVAAPAQQPPPTPVRPRITGISHVAYYVSNLPASVAFWHDLLGFEESYDPIKPDSDRIRIVFIEINDHQHIELFNQPPPVPGKMMDHICFSVDDVEQMRAYLHAMGYEAKPAGSTMARAGDVAITVNDPDGMPVEFVQSLPDGGESRTAEKFMPDTRISTRIFHAGFSVGNSRRSLDFYGRVLGFQETWRGGSDPAELSWINMRVPDGVDYVEFMLYRTLDPKSYGSKNHLSLVVPDVAKAVETLKERPAYATYGKPIDIHLGVNRKRQANLYDPDGTRVELMEPNTIDGKPTPPSAAPPPQSQP